MTKYLNEVRKLKEDTEDIENKFDNRLKLDDYKRILIKLDDLIYRYRAIGKKWHKSAKWIKQVVEDPTLEKIIQDADKCPNCDFEWADFFNKQSMRIKKGLEPKMPKMYLTPQKLLYPNSKENKS